MWDAKMVADLITAARGLLGLIMIWLGITQGETTLPIIVILMLLDWTGDFVDGRIARRSSHPRRTWIGDSDLYIDLFVSLCLAVYLLAAGFASLGFVGLYLSAWALVLWHFGLDRNLLMILQAPIYLYFIMTTLKLLPYAGYGLVAWVLAALVINWRSFTGEIVPRFIHGVGGMIRDNKKPRGS